jgi:hypothetical protein
MTCRRCALRVKTEERLAVPWNDQDLVALVSALLPEGKSISLDGQGITKLLLSGLNATLAQHGLRIHATRGSDPNRLVDCTDKDGWVEQFGLFELRKIKGRKP